MNIEEYHFYKLKPFFEQFREKLDQKAILDNSCIGQKLLILQESEINWFKLCINPNANKYSDLIKLEYNIFSFSG